jgi:phenylalanyl-tRNA synthetase beta chain
MKGVVENLLEALRCPKAVFEPSHLHTLHPGRQAQVKIGKEIVGVLGEVHPLLAQKLDLSEPLFFAELNLHELFPIKKREKKLLPLPSFPGSERDWTITLKEEVPISSIFQSIYSFKSPLLETFFLLDLYKSDKIGKDRKNVTFRFVYRDLEKTIEVETVDKEHARLIERVAEKLRDALVY